MNPKRKFLGIFPEDYPGQKWREWLDDEVYPDGACRRGVIIWMGAIVLFGLSAMTCAILGTMHK